MNRVAVVILNYISWKETLEIATIVHDRYGFEWGQIIIVDNASPNESFRELEKKVSGNYVLLKSETNSGYACGNNLGLRYAFQNGFEYAWILNNDILFKDDNLITELLRIFADDSKVAVVNPDIYDPDGNLYNRDSKRRGIFEYTIGAFFYKKKGRVLDEKNGYGYVYRPQGCCMMVDLKKLSEVDYMDEYTFLYCEEPILAERLLKKDYRCACAYMVKVIHNHSKTVKNVFKKKNMIRIHLKSFDYYLHKYRGFNRIERAICIMFKYLELYMTG